MTVHQRCYRFYLATPIWLWPWLWWQLERIDQWQIREGIEHAFIRYNPQTHRAWVRMHSPSIWKPRPWSPITPVVKRYETDENALDAPPFWSGYLSPLMAMQIVQVLNLRVRPASAKPFGRGPPPVPLAAFAGFLVRIRHAPLKTNPEARYF